jgi:hypothetical protein
MLSMNVAPMYWTLYLPASTSFLICSPFACSKAAQLGQRGSSYSSRVFFASALPTTTVVPFSPELFAGSVTAADSAASQASGLLAWMTP